MAVPPQVSSDSPSVSALLAIDKICRQFEAELEAGRKPQIEDFLGETPEPQRGQLRHELETIQREHGQKSERHVTLAQFVQNLVASGLMNEDQVQTVLHEQPPNQRPQSGDELAKLLHRQGRLTRFQAQAVYQGKTRGLVLGNYVLLDKLGRGGMGQVFRARHRRMGRVVALKMLPPKEMRSQDAVRRFRREVKAAARLSHANIVATHDANEAEGIHFLVMECVEGQDLASLVKQQGPLDVATAVDYVLQAAQGLDYAHRQGVVHRDIKPANILIDEQGVIKVLDMGLARVETPAEGEHSLTHSGQVMGTLDYMSPEQALDTRHVDGRTDIYSLGCTLYYLLTGRPPYGGDTMTKKILAHRENPIPSLREVCPEAPEALAVIFAQMLAKDFEQRQASMAEVIEQLNAMRAELSNVPAPAARTEPALAETVSINADPVPSTSTSRASDVRVRSRALTPREPAQMWRDFQRVISQGYKWLTERLARQSSGPTAAAGSKNRIPRVPLIIGLGGLGVAGLLFGIAFLLRDGDRTVRVEIDPALIKDATVSVWMDGRQMEIAGVGETIRLKPGEHGYEIRRGDEIITAREFTVLKGENPALRITVEGGSDSSGETPLAAQDDQALSDLAQRKIKLWLQKSVFGPQDDTFWENLGVFKPAGRPDYVYFAAVDEIKEKMPEFLQTVEEVRLGPETPRCKTIGPVGLIRWDNSIEIRAQGSWHTVSGLGVAVRRDGQWKEVTGVFSGDWHLSATDRYDPANDDHVALKRLLDQASEAIMRKDMDTLFGWSHSELFGVSPDPAQPEQALVLQGAENRQFSEQALRSVTFDAYKHTITAIKAGGPLAVTISRRERTVAGQTATAEIVNFYGRTEEGWRIIISAEGDWTDLLMAEPQRTNLEPTAEPNTTTWKGILPADAPAPAIAPFDAATAKKHQDAWAKYLDVEVESENSIGMRFVLIPPGEFEMGSTEAEVAKLLEEAKAKKLDSWYIERLPSEAPKHRVRITKPFWLGVHEVTRGQFRRFVDDRKYETEAERKGKGGYGLIDGQWKQDPRFVWNRDLGFEQADDHPVVNVTWNDVTAFCAWLSEKEGEKSCLPTEAQWEYACRAGTTTTWYSGDDEEALKEHGWFSFNAEHKTHRVGQKSPNAWGLCDMHGNAWELCQDWLGDGYYATSPLDDPTGPAGGSRRVHRGGSWAYGASVGRASSRDGGGRGSRNEAGGFRLARAVSFPSR